MSRLTSGVAGIDADGGVRPGASGTVTYRGHTTEVDLHPLGVDIAGLRPHSGWERQWLAEQLAALR